MNPLILIVLGAASYLLGSIPFGLIAGLLRGKDVRAYGSGNLGATNVARVLGLPTGIAVLLADAGKGMTAAGLLPALSGSDSAFLSVICGMAAILGHVFPIFLHFKGGRGVATACGVLLVIEPAATLTALGIWAVIMAWTRYVSAASIVAALSVPALVFLLNLDYPAAKVLELIFTSLIAAIVLLRHIPNIKRLLSGTEHGWR